MLMFAQNLCKIRISNAVTSLALIPSLFSSLPASIFPITPPLPQAAPALNFNHGRKKVWSEREERGISDYHRANISSISI